MNIKNYIVAAIATISASACSNGHINFDLREVTNDEIENTKKIFIGVPLILSMEGSSARLDEDWVVTAAHNKPILLAQGKFDVIYHPTCDIAIYSEKGFNTVEIGTAYIGDAVIQTGYPMAMPMAANKGHIVGDITLNGYPECTMVATTGVVGKGMSGGGVYNDKGELIGIVQGYATSPIVWEDGTKLTNAGIYMHLATVKNWLKEHTGRDYFESDEKNQ